MAQLNRKVSEESKLLDLGNSSGSLELLVKIKI